MNQLFVENLNQYKRRKTHTVSVGDLKMGGEFPIRIQSMTTTNTLDTQKSVAQIIRMVDAGCELVRLTAPSMKEAQNLAEIKKVLAAKGIRVPLIADIHFTPNAAELAARIVEKVRINPGNYADKKRFQVLDYSEIEYREEIDRIREKFMPLLKICKEYGTAMRIGTNHGSLSDRILSKYGDTPLGMVESAMEFLRIAEDVGYYNIVLSMKASNPQVMVQAYRLLVQTMNRNNMLYPLHLGVTEAGDGDDGRIKSALGIGALLEDGLGDTIRVSLTEEPEFEVPVAINLVNRYQGRKNHQKIEPEFAENHIEPDRFYQFQKRKTIEIYNMGGTQLPRVIVDLSHQHSLTEADFKPMGYHFDPISDKWMMNELGADFVFLGSNPVPFMLPLGLKAIYHQATWINMHDKTNAFPYFEVDEFLNMNTFSQTLNFLNLNTLDFKNAELLHKIGSSPKLVLILNSQNEALMPDMRNSFLHLINRKIMNPVILRIHHTFKGLNDSELLDSWMLYSSTDTGSLFIDGFGDGLFYAPLNLNATRLNEIAFGILQAARVRISKTEYISCPSCGRTLFDLQETTALIRKRTDHLKGIKIAIMGCIVNGPGEMADADYGYVGSGPGKITLYRGKDIVKKSVKSEDAVDELIELIRGDGKWANN